MSSDLDILLETDRKFSELSGEKGATVAFATYLGEDSWQLPQGQNAQKGNVMKTEPGEKLTWTPTDGKVSVSGELGYTWGEYVFVLGNGKEIRGKYLNVWTKQNGEWKVEVDMGNTSE